MEKSGDNNDTQRYSINDLLRAGWTGRRFYKIKSNVKNNAKVEKKGKKSK